MASAEVKGSRREWQEGSMTYAEQLHVGDAATLPIALGAAYAGDSEAPAAPLKRVAYSVTVEPEVIPGLWFFRTRYRNWRSYA